MRRKSVQILVSARYNSVQFWTLMGHLTLSVGSFVASCIKSTSFDLRTDGCCEGAAVGASEGVDVVLVEGMMLGDNDGAIV